MKKVALALVAAVGINYSLAFAESEVNLQKDQIYSIPTDDSDHLIEHFCSTFESLGKKSIDPKIPQAVYRVESNGNPSRVSTKGAVGLFQLMPSTARYELKQLGIEGLAGHDITISLTDKNLNTYLAVSHLIRLSDKYRGNLDLMLAAYNAGVSAVSEYNGVPPFEETLKFIIKVKANLEILSK